MKHHSPANELRTALLALKPCFLRAGDFSLPVLAPCVYMLEVYERVVNSRNPFTLLMLTVAVLGAYALMEMLEWARSDIMRAAGAQRDAQLRERVFDALFAARLKRAGGAGTQPLGDLRLVCEFLFSPALLALMQAPIALVMMVLLFLISPVLGWSAVVFALAQVALAWWNEQRTQPPLLEANRSTFGAQQYVDASLRNAEVIESMGMLRPLQGRWLQRQQHFLALQAQASQSAGGLQALGRLLQNILGSLLLGLGCWLFNVRAAWGRLQLLLQTVPARALGMPLPAPRGRLQVEQLVAGVPGGGGAAPILRGIAFALHPGEVLAVIGPSASGKTALARQLVGLWPAQSGTVRLDEVDIHPWNKQELGPHLGYLPQGVELFEGTVAENIARFGVAQPAQVEAAARAMGLRDFIVGLPGGYDSPVGDGGARLSGGHRQRLGLARALYGQPALVVLDEPNAHLDDAGEAALVHAVQALRAQGSTVVLVTHRPGIVAIANRVLTLRHGRIERDAPRDAWRAAPMAAASCARLLTP